MAADRGEASGEKKNPRRPEIMPAVDLGGTEGRRRRGEEVSPGHRQGVGVFAVTAAERRSVCAPIASEMAWIFAGSPEAMAASSLALRS